MRSKHDYLFNVVNEVSTASFIRRYVENIMVLSCTLYFCNKTGYSFLFLAGKYGVKFNSTAFKIFFDF